MAITADPESARKSTAWSPIHPSKNQWPAPEICITASSPGGSSTECDQITVTSRLVASPVGWFWSSDVSRRTVLVEWSVCRPVWVRFRSMGSLPVGYRHPVVDDYQIGVANPQVWTVGTCPVVDSGSACVQTVHSWNTWFWNSPDRSVSEGGIHDSNLRTIDFLEVVGGRLFVWRSGTSRIPYDGPTRTSVVGLVWWTVPDVSYCSRGDGYPRQIRPHMSPLLDERRMSVPRAGVNARVSWG